MTIDFLYGILTAVGLSFLLLLFRWQRKMPVHEVVKRIAALLVASAGDGWTTIKPEEVDARWEDNHGLFWRHEKSRLIISPRTGNVIVPGLEMNKAEKKAVKTAANEYLRDSATRMLRGETTEPPPVPADDENKEEKEE